MYAFPITFENLDQLMDLAKQVIVDSILTSLENDIDLCMSQGYGSNTRYTNAYSPAIIYCFSVIDLLGSLYAGNALGWNTTQNAKNYMMKFMKYPEDHAKLLQRIYRHKLVHLAMPKAVILHKGELLSWKLHDPDRKKHLTIDYSAADTLPIGNKWRLPFVGKFIVSIPKLKEDITDSVKRPLDGYLASLQSDTNLQDKFVIAINQIYDPIPAD